MFVGDMCSDLDIQSNILFGVFLNYWIISFLNMVTETFCVIGLASNRF